MNFDKTNKNKQKSKCYEVVLQESKASLKKMKYIEFEHLFLTHKTINHGNKKCRKWYLEGAQSSQRTIQQQLSMSMLQMLILEKMTEK